MIRINLLKPGRAPAPAASSKTETARNEPPKAAGTHWMSRGEVWTGAAVLAMGFAVLAYLISLPKAPSPADSAAAGPRPVSLPAAVPAAAATPEPPAAAIPEHPQPEARAAVKTDGIAASKPTPARVDVRPSLGPAASFQVSGISIRRQPSALVVVIEVEAGAKYRTMEMQNPSRLVVDVDECRLVMPAQFHTQSVSGPLIQRVRASQYRVDPAVCRIVLDAASFLHYEVRPAPTGLEIRIADGGR